MDFMSWWIRGGGGGGGGGGGMGWGVGNEAVGGGALVEGKRA